jgi:class 3 adenylate cyclase/tetratricopeptide (TPR) repeat protein
VVTCSNCGADNPAGQKFCGECGTALAAVCTTCGAANPPGQKFCGECGTALGAAIAVTPEPSVAVERRLVSVLFADLVGFTSLSEDRDAEEVRDLLSRYFALAADVIGRYGGVVEKFIGDAVMAVWGTPVAQEDDAERAVRAALELVVAVAEFGRESNLPELAARAGVLTGEAAVNLGAAGQGMVAGDLVNTASRVQSAAEPGTVLAGDSTRRATESAIAYAEAGSHELKGKAEPMALWRALRVTAGRAGGLKSVGLEPPFVGRDRELRLAKELFHASADEHRSHLLSITGIAGIGKSRLAWELYKYLDGITQDVVWRRGRCLAYGEGVTYWALAEMIRMEAGIAEGEDPREAGPKLRAALEVTVEDSDERAWLEPRLEQLLSLETKQELEQADLFGGWRLFFERIADRNPVVLAFEDMQWADRSLLDFIEHLLEWSRNHPILVLAMARPELADRNPNWAGRLRNTTTLALESLSDEAMGALLDGFVPGLPAELRGQILERAEGVPLYAVETVRMLLDRGLLEQAGDEYRPTGPIDALEVPETLHALIAARLDGLSPEERRLLQHASVLGKTFTKDALAALSETEAEELLPGLVRKEILSLQADPRSPERGQYGFLQDLLRQVAYESLARRERKSLHLAAADHLERLSTDAEQDAAEIVAAHYLSALELDPDADDAAAIKTKAESTLARAADRAANLGAAEQAQRYLERAIDLTESVARQAELHERAGLLAKFRGNAADARSHYGQAIAAYEELGLTHAAARVTAYLGIAIWHLESDIEQGIGEMNRAYVVLEGDEHDADLAMLTVQLARALYFNGHLEQAMEKNERALEMAEAFDLPDVLSHGLNTKATLLYFGRNRRREGLLLMRHALEVALANDRVEPALRAYNNLAAFLDNEGLQREAAAIAEGFLELARRVGDVGGVLQATAWQAGSLLDLGDWDRALELAETVSVDDRVHVASQMLEANVAAISLLRGDFDEPRRWLAETREGVDPNEAQSVAGYEVWQAGLLVREGRPEEALAAAERALALRDKLGITSGFVHFALESALLAAAELGNKEKFDDVFSIIEQAPPGQVTPNLRALGTRFAAQRATLEHDSASAEVGFRAAARLYGELSWPFNRAEVLLEHAEWLASEGRTNEAEPLAVEAREIFERLRATPYLERLDRLQTGAAAVR